MVYLMNMEELPMPNNASEVGTSETPQKPKNYLLERFKKATRTLTLIFALAAPAAPTASADNNAEHFNRDEITQQDVEILQSAETVADPYLLVLQQQIRDLQESGEMKITTEEEKARGVYLPFDIGYDKSIDTTSGHGGSNNLQKISFENASPEQIKNWEEYMKDKDGWIEKQRVLAEENKEGRKE